MEAVIEGLLNAPNRVVKRKHKNHRFDHKTTDIRTKVPDLIKPPDLNQARVNKCLIALVNRKVVQKENSTVRPLSLPSL